MILVFSVAAPMLLERGTARAGRIDLLDRMVEAKVAGVAARGDSPVYRSPYRNLPRQVVDYVGVVTVATDPARAAFELRESIGLGPDASVSFDLELSAREWFSGAALLSSNATGRLRVTWRPRSGGGAFEREISLSGRRDGKRRQWVPFAGAFALESGRGALSIKNIGRRSLWIGNPVIESATSGPTQPNVVLVMVDTMTAEAVGHLGNKNGVTPHIDSLAARGVAFTNAVTNANWTRPATIVLLAGTYSSSLGINVNSWRMDHKARRAAYASLLDTLPLLARRSSLEAIAIGNNLFTMGYHAAGFDFGFTRIVDYRTEVRDTVDIVSDVEAFLSAPRRSPFFLYVALNAPHHPYVPPSPFLRQVRDVPGVRLDPEVRKYLGEVAYTDDAVGRIARALERAGLAEDTVLVVTSDHGEGLREDNAYTNVVFERPSRFTHTVNLYDEVVRIPLVVAGRGVAKGVRVPTQVRLLDIAPTIAEIMTGRPSPKHHGVSLIPALGGAKIDARPAFTEGKRMSSVRFEGWKYIRREKGYDLVRPFGRGEALSVPEELFDLTKDAREKRNLVNSAPADLDRMRRIWREMQAEVSRRPGGGRAPHAAPSGSDERRRAVTTVVLSSDGKHHELVGEIRTDGRFVDWRLVSGLEQSGVWLTGDNRLLVSMVVEKGESRLNLSTEPSDARIEIVAKLDGREVDEAALKVGAYGLPLGARGGARFSGPGLADLFAARPPFIAHGKEFGVFVWRDARPSVVTTSVEETSTELDSDVESAMRAWGYIQSVKKTGRSTIGRQPEERQKKGDLE